MTKADIKKIVNRRLTQNEKEIMQEMGNGFKLISKSETRRHVKLIVMQHLMNFVNEDHDIQFDILHQCGLGDTQEDIVFLMDSLNEMANEFETYMKKVKP